MIRFLAATALGLGLIGAAHAATYVQKDRATLRALDKITGRSTDIEVKVGEPVVFGSLKVELKACYQTPPEEAPESAAFLQIHSTQPVAVETMEAAVDASEVATTSDDNPELFSGWMYASSPGLSALEHPVYDVWVIRCTATDPVKLPERNTASSDEPMIDDEPPSLDTEPTPE
ncbi:hypothetical protein HY30_16705 [Hyphomonas chukchiensis]|uniref:Cellulase n=1 Tax=Hyphomonas chukchiensis TaxID=1280947 RepID=A0A062UBS9_9PROT|nr:hypothetical protein HY30_16705 [Hyphomonas chukchiensis]